MSSTASHSGDHAAAAAAASSSSAAPAARYYFCHKCFLVTALAPGTSCPLCNDTFVEEINVPPSEAPHPNSNLGSFLVTSCLFTSPASFVLRCRADADAFFRSEISPLRHLRHLPTGRLPDPLANLEERIDYHLAHGTPGTHVYVVLAGVLPPHYNVPSKVEIERLAHRINLDGHDHDNFVTPAAVDALRNVEIDVGPGGGQSCVVCQETLPIGTVATSLPCAHVFHRNCIIPWLQQQHTCPVCRFSPLTEELMGPSHSVFRVIIPPQSLGVDLDENIVVLEEKIRGCHEIPPRRWA